MLSSEGFSVSVWLQFKEGKVLFLRRRQGRQAQAAAAAVAGGFQISPNVTENDLPKPGRWSLVAWSAAAAAAAADCGPARLIVSSILLLVPRTPSIITSSIARAIMRTTGSGAWLHRTC